MWRPQVLAPSLIYSFPNRPVRKWIDGHAWFISESGRRAARAHFGCKTLPGVAIEDDMSDRGIHWDQFGLEVRIVILFLCTFQCTAHCRIVQPAGARDCVQALTGFTSALRACACPANGSRSTFAAAMLSCLPRETQLYPALTGYSVEGGAFPGEWLAM